MFLRQKIKIAFCADHPLFQANRILQIKQSKESPDTAWITIFSKFAKQKNFKIVTGDIALANVQSGNWHPQDILIIQFLDASDGYKLAKLGAIPFMLVGPESPLYAYNFYRYLKKIVPTFRYRLLYSGIYENFKSHPGFNHPFHFPSFNKENILPCKKWYGRKFLVMVAANKYFQKNFPILPNYKTEHFDWIKDKFRIWQSPIRKKAIAGELITKRLEAVEYFGPQNLLHLFGLGWDKLDNLPKMWQKRLKKVLAKLNPKPIRRNGKIAKISNYKFAICFENTKYPGYLTEKIIDCFVAGVIPIYLGAPDITRFVPAGAFVDMRHFGSFAKLDKYLKTINQQEAQKIITKGRDFLKIPKSQLYSHEFMAKFLLNLLLKK